ncbi:hypothetical protein [Paludibacterium purpuratum]|uniref:Uncharacterized protein n=1 Tax=Paludibacterium purpuratum TaxID=1144873 RepID=A0A4R7AVB6_9NEIS|nr:hypothetical protein [Paludibacterium purpuratum]TDR71089.1 hypothetical protein DFP86_12044 [Paludibacterium purpuratum]
MSMKALFRLLCAAAISMLLSPMAQAAGDVHRGVVTLPLRTITALNETGAPDPAMNAACQKEFQPLLGKKVRTEYVINTKTLMMSAKSYFEGHSYPLSALGIAGVYAFAKYFNPPPAYLPLYSVQFMISTQFTQARSRLALHLAQDPKTMCLVSSMGMMMPLDASVPLQAPAK